MPAPGNKLDFELELELKSFSDPSLDCLPLAFLLHEEKKVIWADFCCMQLRAILTDKFSKKSLSSALYP